jgi:hypothetical protein
LVPRRDAEGYGKMRSHGWSGAAVIGRAGLSGPDLEPVDRRVGRVVRSRAWSGDQEISCCRKTIGIRPMIASIAARRRSVRLIDLAIGPVRIASGITKFGGPVQTCLDRLTR